MSGIGVYNLKVLLQDSDFYSLQAVNSYLAWDRRTRVTFMAESLDQMWEHLEGVALAEQPDVIVLDADHAGGADKLRMLVKRLQTRIEGVKVVCLAQFVDEALVEAAARAGARAYFLKRDLRYQVAWAIVYATEQAFVVTPNIEKHCRTMFHRHHIEPHILPDGRRYPELTERIRQAITLCVIEGMPAHLAADEMGISLHTVRSYIKEGYRILESYDNTEYPNDMTPQERAFMRFTALDLDGDAEAETD